MTHHGAPPGMSYIPYNDRIELAISDLESQSQPNFSKTAKEYNVKRVTLTRRYRGESSTKQDAMSNFCKALTDAQEAVLVNRINKLSARGLSPTPHIIRNLAEEIAKRRLNKN